ncbi:MAG TPA: hypothetical protein VFH83_16690 [Spirochaetia bacterium]|nr:hypothetical protein [Spirochaetia bacterium]
MKRSIYLLSIVALAAFILGLGACNLFDSPLTPVPSGTGKGGITIKLQGVSPAMQQLVTQVVKRNQPVSGKALSPKMYLGAQRVEFELWDNPPTSVQDAWTASLDQVNPGNSFIIGTRSHAPGDYQLRAYVYNDPNDITPTVSGIEPFHITADQDAASHQVVVTCFPVNPVVVPESTPSLSYTMAKPWIVNFNNGVISQIGSEQWFQATAQSDHTTFTVSPDAGSGALPVIMVWDSTGQIVGQGMPTAPGVATTAGNIPTTIGGTYYFAAADFSDPTTPVRSFRVSYQPCSITEDLAVSVTPDTTGSPAYTGYSIQTFHAQWYYFSGLQGHIYTVNWDDVGTGSNLYTGDVQVSAYRQDQSTPYFQAIDGGYVGSSYYSNGNYWTYSIDETQTFTPQTSELVYIKVEERNAGATAGTYGLRIEDLGTNHPPWAYAWTNSSSVGTGSPVSIGVNAGDPDMGDTLTYSWVVASGPDYNGLSNANQPYATFTPDAAGTYQLTVTVTDSGTPQHSASSSCYVTAVYNAPPVIDWAYPSTAEITLSGSSVIYLYSGAHDPDGPSVTYQWQLTSVPSGSWASIVGANQANATLAPDVPGAYELQLTVTDTLGGKTPSATITITVDANPGAGGIGVGIN